MKLDMITIEKLEKILGHSVKDFKNEIDVENACIWMDPLDGTKEFVKGKLD